MMYRSTNLAKLHFTPTTSTAWRSDVHLWTTQPYQRIGSAQFKLCKTDSIKARNLSTKQLNFKMKGTPNGQTLYRNIKQLPYRSRSPSNHRLSLSPGNSCGFRSRRKSIPDGPSRRSRSGVRVLRSPCLPQGLCQQAFKQLICQNASTLTQIAGMHIYQFKP